MALNLGELTVKIGADTGNLKRDLASAGRSMDSLLSKAAVSASRQFAIGLAGVATGLGAVAVKGIMLSASMEQSQMAFTTLLGSAEKADQFLRDLWGFAARTPFEFEGLQQSARQLLAFGFRAEEILPMLTSVGDAASALGGGQVEISRIVRALGQMRAKGKVSAEEMQQLAELGIPAWDMLAKKIGIGVPEAMKRAEQGLIPGVFGVYSLMEGMNKRFGGMMEVQSKTLLGMWSTTKDNLAGIMRAIGDDAIKALELKDNLRALNDSLTTLSDTIMQKGIRGILADLFPPETYTTIAAIAGGITAMLIPAAISAATQIGAFALALGPLGLVGALAGVAAYEIATNWGPITQYLSKIFPVEAGSGLDTVIKKLGEAKTALDIWADPKNAKPVDIRFAPEEAEQSKIKGFWNDLVQSTTLWSNAILIGLEAVLKLPAALANAARESANLARLPIGTYQPPSAALAPPGYAYDIGGNLVRQPAGAPYQQPVPPAVRDVSDIPYITEPATPSAPPPAVLPDDIYTPPPAQAPPNVIIDMPFAPPAPSAEERGFFDMWQNMFTPFASGGIVTEPTYGLIGEAGPEAVIPLDRAAGMSNNITINIQRADDPEATAKYIVRQLKLKGVKVGEF